MASSNFWFPIQRDLLMDESFIKSKPSEKLYYFSLLHYLNLHEISYDTTFFKRDLDFAAALNYSEDSVRDARRKFKKLGWLDVRSGFRTKAGQNVATTYHSVKWKDIPEKDEGKRFIRFPHYDFEMMLNLVRKNVISHQDMVVYCYVFCWNQLFGSLPTFYFPKKDLRKYTNIVKAVACVEKLASVPVFGDKAVFDYEDEYHRILFKKLAFAADPYEDDNNNAIFKRYMKAIAAAADKLLAEKKGKELVKAKNKGVIVYPAQLTDLFCDLYKEMYGQAPVLDPESKRNFIALIEKEGVEKVSDALRKYFEYQGQIPNPTKTKTRSLGRFLRVSHMFGIIK